MMVLAERLVQSLSSVIGRFQSVYGLAYGLSIVSQIKLVC